MYNYFISENIKNRHTFMMKLIWLGPVGIMLITLFLEMSYFQQGSLNSWYAFILPVILTLCSAFIIEKENKMRLRAVLPLPLSLKKIWLAKVMVVGMVLFASCIVLFIGLQLGTLFLKGSTLDSIPVINMLVACIVMVVINLWQIPVCMFLTCKIGQYGTLILNSLLNFAAGIVFATTDLWLFVPFSYTDRLMIPILKLLPNALEAKAGNVTFTPQLLTIDVVFTGLAVSIGLFLIFTYLTAKWFAKREAE